MLPFLLIFFSFFFPSFCACLQVVRNLVGKSLTQKINTILNPQLYDHGFSAVTTAPQCPTNYYVTYNMFMLPFYLFFPIIFSYMMPSLTLSKRNLRCRSSIPRPSKKFLMILMLGCTKWRTNTAHKLKIM